jgi:hypothetical protein
MWEYVCQCFFALLRRHAVSQIHGHIYNIWWCWWVCRNGVDKLHEKPKPVCRLGPIRRLYISKHSVHLLVLVSWTSPPVSPPTVSYKPKPHVCSPEIDIHRTPAALLVPVDRNSEEPHAIRWTELTLKAFQFPTKYSILSPKIRITSHYHLTQQCICVPLLFTFVKPNTALGLCSLAYPALLPYYFYAQGLYCISWSVAYTVLACGESLELVGTWEQKTPEMQATPLFYNPPATYH